MEIDFSDLFMLTFSCMVVQDIWRVARLAPVSKHCFSDLEHCVEAAKVASKKLLLRVEALRGRTEARLSSEGRGVGVGVGRQGNAGKEMKDWERVGGRKVT